MLKGECISNGTYFRDSDLQILGGTQDGYIHCVLRNETPTEGLAQARPSYYMCRY